MLRLRFLTAFIGVPVLLALTVIGGWPYVAMVVVAAAIGMFEIRTMLVGAGFRPLAPVGIVLGVLIVLDALATDLRVLPAILVLTAVTSLCWMMRRENTTGALVDWGLTLAPGLPVGGTLHYGVLLRWVADENGVLWVLIVLICTWTCDITAF